MEQGIIWFRNDLRIADNSALTAALNSGLILKAFYVLDDRVERMGPFRKRFIKEALVELKLRLNAFNIQLDITEGNPVAVLATYFSQTKQTSVFANAGYAFEEQQQEELLRSRPNISLKLFEDGFLIPPSVLPFTVDSLPDVFTVFRKKVEHVGIDNLLRDYSAKPLETMDGANTNPITDFKSAFPFRGGESAAIHRLQHYLWNTKKILNYKVTRNELLGTEYSSKFSAWLACGCISAQQIYYEIKCFERAVEANESTYWLVFELLWRDYFRYVMLKFGIQLFRPGGIKSDKTFIEPKDAAQRFEKWVNGATGDDFVDANMRELKYTGFMSNRGRQNVASYLVHQLMLDWRRGARYFEKMLVDYDVFSNWGNWAYLAGVGNDPRENRTFNTQKQAEMYDADKSFRKTWL